jgi:hypothetical protein
MRRVLPQFICPFSLGRIHRCPYGPFRRVSSAGWWSACPFFFWCIEFSLLLPHTSRNLTLSPLHLTLHDSSSALQLYAPSQPRVSVPLAIDPTPIAFDNSYSYILDHSFTHLAHSLGLSFFLQLLLQTTSRTLKDGGHEMDARGAARPADGHVDICGSHQAQVVGGGDYHAAMEP